MRFLAATILLCLASVSAEARPSPYLQITPFNGDRYSAHTQMGPDVARAGQVQRAAKKLNRRATAAQRKHMPAKWRTRGGQKRWDIPTPAPRPLAYEPYRVEAMPTRMLAGVVAPLAAKARQIVADCGSKIISGVRHTYIAGTGGRLSLHASGRAVDIKGNPACIRAHLHGWPGGASTDYAAVNHTHISYAPNGPEWGKRFAHYRGGHRHRRHVKRPRRVATGPWLSGGFQGLAVLSEGKVKPIPRHAIGIEGRIDVDRLQFRPRGRAIRPGQLSFVKLLDHQNAPTGFMQKPLKHPLAVRRPLLPDALTEVLTFDRVPKFAQQCGRISCIAHNHLRVSNSPPRWISIRQEHYSIMGFRAFSKTASFSTSERGLSFPLNVTISDLRQFSVTGARSVAHAIAFRRI